MGWIILLLILGVLLFFAELVLLPGITIAGIGAFCSFVGAAVIGFVKYQYGGFWILALIILILALMIALFLRPKTWSKVALNAEIKDSFEKKAEETVAVGTEGETLTRLAPMGKVLVGGISYEAKSLDSFIDQKQTVIVTGYDNSSLIVKAK